MDKHTSFADSEQKVSISTKAQGLRERLHLDTIQKSEVAEAGEVSEPSNSQCSVIVNSDKENREEENLLEFREVALGRESQEHDLSLMSYNSEECQTVISKECDNDLAGLFTAVKEPTN